MTSMVERMARAMAGEIIKNGSGKGSYDNLSDGSKMLLANICIAALREMREPTEVMVDGAYEGASLDDKWLIEDDRDYRKSFRSAIDAEIAAYEADRASPVLRPPS